MASHSGNVARPTSCLANKLSWKLETQKNVLSTKKWNNSQTPKCWGKYTIVLTISRELSVSAMAVMIISRTFVTWRSEYPKLWRKASFRDLDQQKRKHFFNLYWLHYEWLQTRSVSLKVTPTGYTPYCWAEQWPPLCSLSPAGSRGCQRILTASG